MACAAAIAGASRARHFVSAPNFQRLRRPHQIADERRATKMTDRVLSVGIGTFLIFAFAILWIILAVLGKILRQAV